MITLALGRDTSFFIGVGAGILIFKGKKKERDGVIKLKPASYQTKLIQYLSVISAARAAYLIFMSFSVPITKAIQHFEFCRKNGFLCVVSIEKHHSHLNIDFRRTMELPLRKIPN